MEARLERLNLNIPSSTRETLKRLAKASGRKEAEVARDLLVEAARQAQRREYVAELARAMTPEFRQQLIELAGRMERLRAGEG